MRGALHNWQARRAAYRAPGPPVRLWALPRPNRAALAPNGRQGAAWAALGRVLGPLRPWQCPHRRPRDRAWLQGTLARLHKVGRALARRAAGLGLDIGALGFAQAPYRSRHVWPRLPRYTVTAYDSTADVLRLVW